MRGPPKAILGATASFSARPRRQGVDGRIEFLGAWEADELVPDDAAVVEDVQGRPAVDVELAGDRAAGVAAVPPGPPGDLLLLHPLLELVPVPSLLTPSRTNGLPSIFFTSDRSCGYMARQGPHQSPQKSTTTTLPL